jgi:hypothetical protein
VQSVVNIFLRDVSVLPTVVGSLPFPYVRRHLIPSARGRLHGRLRGLSHTTRSAGRRFYVVVVVAHTPALERLDSDEKG